MLNMTMNIAHATFKSRGSLGKVNMVSHCLEYSIRDDNFTVISRENMTWETVLSTKAIRAFLNRLVSTSPIHSVLNVQNECHFRRNSFVRFVLRALIMYTDPKVTTELFASIKVTRSAILTMEVSHFILYMYKINTGADTHSTVTW